VKTLILDNDNLNDSACGLDLALRAESAGHKVRYCAGPGSGPWGNGMIEKVEEWEPSMDWADLIILTGNATYADALAPYFGKGYPIFGTNSKAAEMELDRAHGQEMLKRYGVDTLPYHTADSIDSAIALVRKHNKPFAIKPWGGTSDKAMTCVPRDTDEAIFMLSRWKEKGLKGQLMLQEKVDGIEMGIAGWFGPGGFSEMLEESFEHKKFLNDDLGCNTGEMGTVIRHVKQSKLFNQVLQPMEEYLHECNYVGDCNINCIIDEDGKPWPLEFTMRLGWPDFCIRQPLVVGDPLEWMADLVRGKDSFDTFDDVALGILIVHGDFPNGKDGKEAFEGFPIHGINKKDLKSVHFQMVSEGSYESAAGRKEGLLTAGKYLMVVTGTGETVKDAQKRAYDVAWKIEIPSNTMFRTDIGERLADDLPALHRLGYARGMDFV
jgi:phosphoribosylamine--glycine ligase